MLNKNSLFEVENNYFSKNFLKPMYKSYCFSNIPGTIMKNFGINGYRTLPEDVYGNMKKEYKKIVFFFLDAFGWKFLEENKTEVPFLSELIENGVLSKLTSQFPSTTSAHVTTAHTALQVGESGVYEWNYYDPNVDEVITPLLNSMAESWDKKLIDIGVKSEDIYPTKTIFKKLNENGVVSRIFENISISVGEYSDFMLKDAIREPFETLEDGLNNLVKYINDEKEKGYYFFYFSDIDHTAHKYGPDSDEVKEVISNFFESLKIYLKQIRENNNTLCIFTADHGMANVNLDTPFYLNKELPELDEFIKTNKNGKKIIKCGSYRDVFLHIKKEKIEIAYKLLKNKLKNIAEIYKTKEIIEKGFFGNTTKRLLERIGDIVILPYENRSVWWYEENAFNVEFPGMHGGLSKEEMEIPFLLYRI